MREIGGVFPNSQPDPPGRNRPPSHCGAWMPGSTAGKMPVVSGSRFALSAQPHFLSLPQKRRRAGEKRRFLSISPLSDSLPARSSRGERGKTPQAFCVPNTTGKMPTATEPEVSSNDFTTGHGGFLAFPLQKRATIEQNRVGVFCRCLRNKRPVIVVKIDLLL